MSTCSLCLRPPSSQMLSSLHPASLAVTAANGTVGDGEKGRWSGEGRNQPTSTHFCNTLLSRFTHEP